MVYSALSLIYISLSQITVCEATFCFTEVPLKFTESPLKFMLKYYKNIRNNIEVLTNIKNLIKGGVMEHSFLLQHVCSSFPVEGYSLKLFLERPLRILVALCLLVLLLSSFHYFPCWSSLLRRVFFIRM
jgi:hypothetical protein